MNRHLKTADGILAELADINKRRQAILDQAEAEVASVMARHQMQLGGLNAQSENLDKTLKALMKEEKTIVFNGKDIVYLKHGSLKHSKEEKVSIPKKALEEIKRQGWLEGIKVSEAVDRETVKNWPVERLTLIGAKKRPVDTYSYELKEG